VQLLHFAVLHFTLKLALNSSALYREPIDIFSTLVHEMCHLWQWEFGHYSRSGYHNKEWAKKMIEIGLMPSDTGKVGGKKTGQHMTHFIIKNGAYELAFLEMPKDFILPFTSLEGDIMKSLIEGVDAPTSPKLKGKSVKSIPAKVNSKTKFSCPCGENAWGKPTLNLRCQKCGGDFFTA